MSRLHKRPVHIRARRVALAGLQRDGILSKQAAAIAMTSSADAADPAVSRFLDAVWMERGLSPNTLAAYRADLTALVAMAGGAQHRR